MAAYLAVEGDEDEAQQGSNKSVSLNCNCKNSMRAKWYLYKMCLVCKQNNLL